MLDVQKGLDRAANGLEHIACSLMAIEMMQAAQPDGSYEEACRIPAFRIGSDSRFLGPAREGRNDEGCYAGWLFDNVRIRRVEIARPQAAKATL
jgi:hypothetical protein